MRQKTGFAARPPAARGACVFRAAAQETQPVIPPVLPTYARAPLTFVEGQGPWLVEESGARYLDLGGGIAVTALGHAHPALVKALEDQGRRLWHVSNLYRIAEQEALAERLVAATFADTVFFTNSGTEAMELAVKMARRRFAAAGQPERHRIVTFEGAFHGRSIAAISATKAPKMIDGFGPLLPGFDILPFGDHDALRAAIGPQTAGVLVEPIQGEGGIRVLPEACLKGLRALCDEHGILMMLDEVQCGMGRTGRLFAHEWAGVTPDIMMVAKGIGGGFPLGAVLATEDAASGMVAGTHGSTYGGNPLACAVGCAVMDAITAPGLSRRREPRLGPAAPGARGPRRRAPVGVRARARARPDARDRMRRSGRRRGPGRLRRPCHRRAGGRERRAAAAAAEPHRRRDRRGPAPARRRRRRGGGGLMPSFLDLHVTPAGDLRAILDDAHALKAARDGATMGAPDAEQPLAGRIVALVFEKPSTRTRVSFDVGVRQMGGETLVLSGAEMQLGHGETVADTARVLSRYVDMIMIRTFEAQTLHEMAEHATVPVINGLTNASHPCQIMADMMTYEEARGPIAGRKVVWTGDGNNTCNSFLHAAGQFGYDFAFAGPEALDPAPEAVAFARSKGVARGHRARRAARRRGRRSRRHRHLDLDARRAQRARAALQAAPPLSGQRAADGARQPRRALHALPARPPRGGGHQRGDGRPAVGGLRRGREPPARPEGDHALVPRGLSAGMAGP